jgi:hypothetical protein
MDWNKIKIEIAKTAMSSFISRPNHGYSYEEISIMSRRYAEEMLKQLNGDYEKEIANKAKEEMIKTFKDWFCEPYCRFYGNEDYCKTCLMNKKMNL